MTWDRFSIIPHGVSVEASNSLRGDVLGWRQSKTRGKTIQETVIIWQCAPANAKILAGDDPALDTTNTDPDFDKSIDPEWTKFHWIAKVGNISEIWHGSPDLHATQSNARVWNPQMTAGEHLSDSEEILKVSSFNNQHAGTAVFKLQKRWPVSPALSAKVLPGGQRAVLNVSLINRIDPHPAACTEDSSSESILDNEN